MDDNTLKTLKLLKKVNEALFNGLKTAVYVLEKKMR